MHSATVSGQAPLTSIDSARHVLNRLGYGATPGEVETVAREGVMKWVDRQLGFDDVRDPGLADVERGFEVLHTPMSEMVAMQAENQKKVQQAQAIPDSMRRAQMLDQIKAEQAMNGGRKGLQQSADARAATR